MLPDPDLPDGLVFVLKYHSLPLAAAHNLLTRVDIGAIASTCKRGLETVRYLGQDMFNFDTVQFIESLEQPGSCAGAFVETLPGSIPFMTFRRALSAKFSRGSGNPLCLQAAAGNAEFLRLLLESKLWLNPNVRDQKFSNYNRAGTPLLLAIDRSNLEVVRLLVGEYGVNKKFGCNTSGIALELALNKLEVAKQRVWEAQREKCAAGPRPQDQNTKLRRVREEEDFEYAHRLEKIVVLLFEFKAQQATDSDSDYEWDQANSCYDNAVDRPSSDSDDESDKEKVCWSSTSTTCLLM